MEITKDTKIGDLIPEGCELAEQNFLNEAIHIYYKKKQPKTYEEYKKDYENDWMGANFNTDKMRFLQYICQDLGISNEKMFVFIYKYITEQPLTDEFAILRDILPDNFIDELVV